MSVVRAFFLGLAFLTRLGSAGSASTEEMADACLLLPLVGAVLGALTLLPLCLFPCPPFMGAWIYVLLNLWLARALHADGLADLADALGSNKTGPDFLTVLKDSRIGAFGVIALFAAYSGQLIAIAGCLEKDLLPPLFFAPVFGRSLPICLAALSPPHPGATLGALLAAAPRKTGLYIAAGCCLPLGLLCLGPWRFLAAAALALLVLAFLTRVARRMGGWNGDYLGAAIVAGECCCLFVAAV